MARTRSTYLALIAVLLLPMVANAGLISQDLGAGSYTASSEWGPYTADLAFDGDVDTNWNAGDWPVAWIEVDLGQLFDITMFSLLVAQLPDANTTHQIWLSSSSMQSDLSAATLAYTFDGYTAHLDTLAASLASPISAQFVQIRTTASPSWVAWFEVQVYGDPVTVPEPGTLALFAIGLAGMGLARRRKRSS